MTNILLPIAVLLVWLGLFFSTKDTVKRITRFVGASFLIGIVTLYSDASLRRDWGPIALLYLIVSASWLGGTAFLAAYFLRKRAWLGAVVSLAVFLAPIALVVADQWRQYERRMSWERLKSAVDGLAMDATLADAQLRCRDLGAECLRSAFRVILRRQKTVEACAATLKEILGHPGAVATDYTAALFACLRETELSGRPNAADLCEAFPQHRAECLMSAKAFGGADCQKLFSSHPSYAAYCRGFQFGKQSPSEKSVERSCLDGKEPNKVPWERPKGFVHCLSGGAAASRNSAICSLLYYSGDIGSCRFSAKTGEWPEAWQNPEVTFPPAQIQ